ncbi:hypothetical protein [Acidimangrovimonas sediminis]|uniref:hypothetical protein n=1 Tax=Acidimangrovimonas sediminis TaxID=2056283 RepID=UPI000C7F873F|nr:hypothetical protein [Acidimangrovimonas sediminis]
MFSRKKEAPTAPSPRQRWNRVIEQFNTASAAVIEHHRPGASMSAQRRAHSNFVEATDAMMAEMAELQKAGILDEIRRHLAATYGRT